MNIFQKIRKLIYSKPKTIDTTIYGQYPEIKEKEERSKFNGICEFCNKGIKSLVRIFYCKYCKEWHCSKHRLPEKHNCKGNPKAPKGGLREIYVNGKLVAFGK